MAGQTVSESVKKGLRLQLTKEEKLVTRYEKIIDEARERIKAIQEMLK